MVDRGRGNNSYRDWGQFPYGGKVTADYHQDCVLNELDLFLDQGKGVKKGVWIKKEAEGYGYSNRNRGKGRIFKLGG